MRGVLEPIFGERGALAAEFLISVLIVLALVVAIVWAIRRYADGGVGLRRARVARLAIVDAMAVDARRRLVLVRRDHVEHLILIGGPSDLVVEPSILRSRAAATPAKPVPAPAATSGARAVPAPTSAVAAPSPPAPVHAAAAPQPPPPLPVPMRRAGSGSAEPIPFPPSPGPAAQRPAARAAEPLIRRIDPAAVVANAPEPLRRAFPVRPGLEPAIPPPPPPPPPEPASAPGSSMARLAELVRPPRPEPPAPPTADEPPPARSEPVAEAPPATAQRVAEDGDQPHAAEAASDDFALPDFLSRQRPAEGPGEEGRAEAGDSPQKSNDEQTAAKVSDLEKEMARLLGEISSRRSS